MFIERLPNMMVTTDPETCYTSALLQITIKDSKGVAEFSFGYTTEADPVQLRDAAKALLAAADHLERIQPGC